MEAAEPFAIRLGSRRAFASWVPFGLGHPGSSQLPVIARAAWAGRHASRFALDVLRHGVCGTCELGTDGLRDDAVDGVHLCARRLEQLPSYLSEAFDPDDLPDIDALWGRTPAQLRALGRIPRPLIWRTGQRRFVPMEWNDAIHFAATRIRQTQRPWAMLADPSLPSNEAFFCLQSVARTLGTPHIDLTRDAGHRLALSLLQWTGGHEAGTCSLVDITSADLVVLWGLGLRRHPFLGRLLHLARARGTRVIAIGPTDEPEYDGAWLQAGLDAALFGSRLVDEHVRIPAGGDRALAWGLLKALSEQGGFDDSHLATRVTGAKRLRSRLSDLSWDRIEAGCGLPEARVRHLARVFGAADRGVVALGAAPGRGPAAGQSLGAMLAITLVRGWLGRPGAGVLPLGGEPGVRGARDAGFGPDLGIHGGWKAREIVRRATVGELDLLWVAGEGLDELLPPGVDHLSTLPVHVHQATFLDASMLVPAGEAVLVLPVQSRYESRGGATFTSVDRRVRFSPEILGHPVGEARPDWQVACQIAVAVDAKLANRFDPIDAGAVREMMARQVPRYDRIDRLCAPGDGFQWGGSGVHHSAFDTEDGRARMPPIDPPPAPRAGLRLATRRTGEDRRSVAMAATTAVEQGLEEGAEVTVHSDWGQLRGRVRFAPIHPGTVTTYWPEGRVLYPPDNDPGAADGPPQTVRLEATS